MQLSVSGFGNPSYSHSGDSVGATLVVALFCLLVYRAGTRPAPTGLAMTAGVVIISQVANSKSLASLGASDLGVSLKSRGPPRLRFLVCVVVCVLLIWFMTAFNSPLYSPMFSPFWVSLSNWMHKSCKGWVLPAVTDSNRSSTCLAFAQP